MTVSISKDMQKQDKLFVATIATMISIAVLAAIFVFAEAKTQTGTTVQKGIGLYEDEILACNFEGSCKIIAVDNYLSDEGLETLGAEFNANIDTFTLKDFSVK
jgi:hypothetical protein